jgi:hypothetical protein
MACTKALLVSDLSCSATLRVVRLSMFPMKPLIVCVANKLLPIANSATAGRNNTGSTPKDTYCSVEITALS